MEINACSPDLEHKCVSFYKHNFSIIPSFIEWFVFKPLSDNE